MVSSSTPDAYAISITDHNTGHDLYWAGQWFSQEVERACRYSETGPAHTELRRIAKLGQAAATRMRVVPHPIQASAQLEAES